MSTDNRPLFLPYLLFPQALENLLVLVLQDEKFPCYTTSLAKIQEPLLLLRVMSCRSVLITQGKFAAVLVSYLCICLAWCHHHLCPSNLNPGAICTAEGWTTSSACE